MNRLGTRHSFDATYLVRPTPWLFAILLFGVGDLVTTSAGLVTPGIVEVDPFALWTLSQFGVGGLVGMKLLVFAICYLVWRVVPRPYCWGVPLGLTVLGAVVTTWNVMVITTVAL